MHVDQKDVDELNVAFVEVSSKFPSDQRSSLMRQYTEKLNKDGETGARQFLSTLSIMSAQVR